MTGLTPRQGQVLDFIAATVRERGFPPTLREIVACLGVRGTNTVEDHLRALEKKGFITRDQMKARTIRITPRVPPAPPMEACSTRCPRCMKPTRGVYTCITCRRFGCSAACLACPCEPLGAARRTA